MYKTVLLLIIFPILLFAEFPNPDTKDGISRDKMVMFQDTLSMKVSVTNGISRLILWTEHGDIEVDSCFSKKGKECFFVSDLTKFLTKYSNYLIIIYENQIDKDFYDENSKLSSLMLKRLSIKEGTKELSAFLLKNSNLEWQNRVSFVLDGVEGVKYWKVFRLDTSKELTVNIEQNIDPFMIEKIKTSLASMYDTKQNKDDELIYVLKKETYPIYKTKPEVAKIETLPQKRELPKSVEEKRALSEPTNVKEEPKVTKTPKRTEAPKESESKLAKRYKMHSIKDVDKKAVGKVDKRLGREINKALNEQVKKLFK